MTMKEWHDKFRICTPVWRTRRRFQRLSYNSLHARLAFCLPKGHVVTDERQPFGI